MTNSIKPLQRPIPPKVVSKFGKTLENLIDVQEKRLALLQQMNSPSNSNPKNPSPTK